MSLSEKRTTQDNKLSNFRLESNNNLTNTTAVKQMFNQCLSKNAAASLTGISTKNNDPLDMEISPYMNINNNPDREASFNKKKEDFYAIESDLPSNKRNEVESEIDSYINNSSDCKSFKKSNFSPNYKVESSLNVNVNLVTYPDYFANSNNNDKVSLSKNASINLSNSSANYPKNIKNIFSSSGYPATNISNFANININNTLPQILINPSTNLNNQNNENALNVDYIEKKENYEKNDLIRNFNSENKMSKENKSDEKFKSYSNLKKANNQKDLHFEKTVVYLFIFNKLNFNFTRISLPLRIC